MERVIMLLLVIGIGAIADFAYNLAATRVMLQGNNPIAQLERRLAVCQEIIPNYDPETEQKWEVSARVEQCFNSAWSDLREDVGSYKITCNVYSKGNYGISKMSAEPPMVFTPRYYNADLQFLFRDYCRS